MLQRLATGWTVCGSNPNSGEIFRTRLEWPWSSPSLLYTVYRVSFPGVKQPRSGAKLPPASCAEVKEESCTFTFSLGLHGLLQGELYFYLLQTLKPRRVGGQR